MFKRIVGSLAATLALSISVAAADASLAGIDAGAVGNVTTITLHASGAFTHKEFTPSGTLIFLDLAGVTPGQFANATHPLHLPGVVQYHVSTYKEPAGTTVTRVEVTLQPNTTAAFRELPDGLALKLSAAPVAAAASASPAAGDGARKPVLVEGVGVSHTPDGMQIEIAADGPVQQKNMRIAGPDRVVIDLMNSVPSVKAHNLAVNGAEAHGVRVAQYTAQPPVTRVVVDLGANVEYDVVPQGNHVLVNLHSAATHASAAATTPAAKAPAPPTAIAKHSAEGTTLANTAPAPVKSSSPAAAPAMKPVAAKVNPPAAHAESTPAPAPVKAAAVTPKPAVATSAATNNTPANAPVNNNNSTAAVASAPAATPVAQNATPSAAATTPESHDAGAEPAAETQPAQPQKPADSEAKNFVSVNLQPKARSDQDPTGQNTMPATPVDNATGSTPAASGAVNLAREQQQTMGAQKPAPRPRYTGAPYSFNLKDADLKDFFRAIAEITGLNIVLDPNVHGQLTLDLHDVPWDQALDIVLENNGLDKQLDGNVLRIATVDTMRKEAEAQLAKVQAQALAVNTTTYTHYLSYAHAKDVVPTIKKFVSQRGEVLADERTNAVIVRDIPATIPEIQRLLVQLDRKTQQVEIEARVVAATRNFAREIGTQLGFGTGGTIAGAQASIGGTPAVGTTPTQVAYVAPPPYVTVPGVPLSAAPAAGQPPTTTAAGIPLFSNLGVTAPTSGIGATITAGNYRLDAVLTLAENRGLLKVISRPGGVTQNNTRLLVRQGVRVPVVTQAQLGGPPTVTYVDAFLQLTVTPQITAEGTIFLNLELENTTPDFSHEVQGNPTLVTQQELTQVLVTNGGTVQIGGVMLTQNNVNVFQVPILGDIPILGNAFKHRQVSTTTQELIFFITPKILET